VPRTLQQEMETRVVLCCHETKFESTANRVNRRIPELLETEEVADSIGRSEEKP